MLHGNNRGPEDGGGGAPCLYTIGLSPGTNEPWSGNDHCHFPQPTPNVIGSVRPSATVIVVFHKMRGGLTLSYSIPATTVVLRLAMFTADKSPRDE